MPFSPVRYVLARLHHPGEFNAQFLRMGLGIEQRSQTLRRYWLPHQDMCRHVQREWIGTFVRRDRLTILGAGRLLDAAIKEFTKEFSSIILVDADRLCEPYWRRVDPRRSKLRFEFTDISGVVEAWVERVRVNLRDGSSGAAQWKRTLDLVRGIACGEQPSHYRVESGPVVSLNLLSQLPIVWQDALEILLERHFGREWLSKHEKEWIEAMQASARWMVEAHLRALGECGASFLLITDQEYVYYRNSRPYRSWRYAEPPVEWDGGWKVLVEGVSCEIEPALYGLDLGDSVTLSRMLPAHEAVHTQGWLWHISPLGIENAGEGVLHRVVAVCFECKK